ncbi:conjugative transposon protein TraN [soil metagenome]
MKWNRVIVNGIVISLFATKSFAQIAQTSFIQSYHLNITCNKTTNLIFPFAVQSADRGSKDVLVQKVKDAENVLQLKADRPHFPETNLTVITTDGKLYSFIVDYASEPLEMNIAFNRDTSTSVIFSETISNEKKLNVITQKIDKSKRTMHGVNDKHDDMRLSLNGLYVYNDVFYFQLSLQNKSFISYDINAIRFFIRDRQKCKRNATQETEIKPLYLYGNIKNVKGKSVQSCVIALPKFTLPDAKYLSVQILEKNGGRDLHLNLQNWHIMQVKPIEPNKME